MNLRRKSSHLSIHVCIGFIVSSLSVIPNVNQGPVTESGDICQSKTSIFGLKWVNIGKVGVFVENLIIHKICSRNPFCPWNCSEPSRFSILRMVRADGPLAVKGLTTILFKVCFNKALSPLINGEPHDSSEN